MAVIDTPILTELAARTESATKVYGSGDTQVTALDHVDVAGLVDLGHPRLGQP